MTLKDQRVLVLGGTSGIGLAVADAAANEGAMVAVVSSQQSKVQAALQCLPEGVQGHVADLADEKSVEALFRDMQPFDHMVFTAGDSVWQRAIGETEFEDAQRFFGVRYWGAVFVAKHGSKLIRPGGSMTFTSSTLPRKPAMGFAIGASINGAVEALTVALAKELAPVRVNAVAPGIIRTPIWNRLAADQREAYFRERGATLPVGRVGEPADVAEAYLFLMRSGFTTGQVIVVDGGMSFA